MFYMAHKVKSHFLSSDRHPLLHRSSHIMTQNFHSWKSHCCTIYHSYRYSSGLKYLPLQKHVCPCFRRIKWPGALQSRQKKDSRIELEVNPWQANLITLATLGRKKKRRKSKKCLFPRLSLSLSLLS